MDTGTRQQLSIDGRLTFMLNGFNYVAPLHPALYSNTLFLHNGAKNYIKIVFNSFKKGLISFRFVLRI